MSSACLPWSLLAQVPELDCVRVRLSQLQDGASGSGRWWAPALRLPESESQTLTPDPGPTLHVGEPANTHPQTPPPKREKTFHVLARQTINAAKVSNDA